MNDQGSRYTEETMNAVPRGDKFKEYPLPQLWRPERDGSCSLAGDLGGISPGSVCLAVQQGEAELDGRECV